MTSKPETPPPSLLAALRSGAWLDRVRVVAWGRLLLILEAVALIALAAGTYGLYVPLELPSSTDFISFFAAGRLADAGAPWLAYVPAYHHAMEQQVFGDPRLPYAYFFFYPPTFILVCAGLALIPWYLGAFAFWAIVTGALFALSLRLIIKDWPQVIAYLSFPAAAATIGIGQNSMLTAALFGFATYFIDRRPFCAGLLFGAIVYKPHFLLIAPVALLAGRHWRALAGMAVSAAAIVALSWLCFGTETWLAFLGQAQVAAASFSVGRVGYAGLVSLFAAARLLGADLDLAYVIQGLTAVAAAALVAWVWWRGGSLPVRALVLIAATLIAPPVILFYDLLPAAIAIAWLVLDARKTGFLPWEKLVLCVIWIVPILSRGIGIALEVPIGPIATIALLALAAIRARNEWRVSKP